MTLQEKIAFALDYLNGIDLVNAEVGRFEVNDDFYYLVQSYDSKELANCKLETHDHYLDIQMVVYGKEAIDFCLREGLTEKAPYNPVKDVTFYEVPENLGRTVLTDGSYMILYPEIAHMPGIRCTEEPVKVRKIVGKVKI